MRHSTVAASLTVALAFASSARAQDPRPLERGLPLIQLYGEEAHGGGSQNFGVASGPRGHIYVANLHGLLIFDGARFQLAPQESALYAVAVGRDGEVVAGGPRTLVHLVAGPRGEPVLKSILELLAEEKRDFGDLRSILAVESGFVLLTDARVLVYDGRALTSVAELSNARGGRIFVVRGRAYLTGEKEILRLEGLELRAAAELSTLDGRQVDALLEDGTTGFLAAVRGAGLVRVDENGLTRIRGEVSSWAKANEISSSRRLRDGRIILGSRSSGALLAGSAEAVEQRIDTERGLPDDQVAGMEEDRDGGLWMALDAGLARLDVGSSVTVFDRRAGVQGNPHATFRHDGRMYVSGSTGLGVIENGVLRRIEGISGSTWSSLGGARPRDGFLVATASGIFNVVRNRARLVPGTAEVAAYVLARAQGFDGILVGGRAGLYLLRPTKKRSAPPEPSEDPGLEAASPRAEPGEDGAPREAALPSTRYRLVGPLAGSPRYVRSIVVRPSGRAFLATVFDGLVAVDFDPEDPENAKFEKLGGGEGDIHEGPDGLIAVTMGEKCQVYTIDEATPRLVLDEARTRSLGGLEAWHAASDAAGNLWLNTAPPRVFPRKDGVLLSEAIVLRGMPVRHIEGITAEPDGEVWLSSDSGIYRHIGPPASGLTPPGAPALGRVMLDDTLIFDGWSEGAKPPATLPRNLTRLRIEFAPLSSQRGLAYRFRLDPIDGAWTEWSAQNAGEYTTLQPDHYVFRVETRGADGSVGPETAWSFSIAPPWYRTAGAAIAAALLLVALIFGVVGLRTRSFRREAAHLAQRVEEKTNDLVAAIRELEETRERLAEQNRLLEDANARLDNAARHDPLTGLANRRYFDEFFGEEWARSRRQRTPLALGILDLDHFKVLNDTFGHPEGDVALRAVAAALKAGVQRESDLVARYGGEEFVFVLAGTDIAGARRVAEDLRARIEALGIINPGGANGILTASFGIVAAVPAREITTEDFIQAADRALYMAKDAGRNNVRAVEITA